MKVRSPRRSLLVAGAFGLVPALVGCGAGSAEPRGDDLLSGGGIIERVSVKDRTDSLAISGTLLHGGDYDSRDLLGLMFTGLFWRVPWAGRTVRVGYRPRVGLAGAPLVGVLFGLGIPFLLAALSVSKARSRFSWARQNARVVMWTGGGMLVLLGLLQVSGLWLELISRLQGVIANWQVPL